MMPGTDSRNTAKAQDLYAMLDDLEPERKQLEELDRNRDAVRRSLEKKIAGIKTRCQHPLVVEGYWRGDDPFEETLYRCCLACGTMEHADAHYEHRSRHVHTPHFTFEKVTNPKKCVSVGTDTYTRACRLAPLSAREIRSLSRLGYESLHKLDALLEEKLKRQ
jgi:hypothetical protein